LEHPWIESTIPTFPTLDKHETKIKLTALAVRARECSAAPLFRFKRYVVRILREPAIDKDLVRETYPDAWASALTKVPFVPLSLDDGKSRVDPVPAGLPKEDVCVSPGARRMYLLLYKIALENGLNRHCIGKDYRSLAMLAGYCPSGTPDGSRAHDEIKLAEQEGILSILDLGTIHSKGAHGKTAIFCLRGATEKLTDAEADGMQCREYKKRMQSVNAASSSNGTQPNRNNGSSAKPVTAAPPIAANNDAGPQISSSTPAARADGKQKPMSSIPDRAPKVAPPMKVPADNDAPSSIESSTSETPRRQTSADDPPRAAADDSRNDSVLASNPADGSTESPNSTPGSQGAVVETKSGPVVVTTADVDEVMNKTYHLACNYDLSPRRPWGGPEHVHRLIEMLGTKEAVIQRYADAAAAGLDRFDLQLLKWFADWVSDEIKEGRENSWLDHLRASGTRPRVPRFPLCGS
jgi:hypothetical protein